MKKSYEIIGQVGVDAGLLWLGDPCYVLHRDAGEEPKDIGTDWSDFCKRLEAKSPTGPTVAQFNHDLGHVGLGVAVSTGYGDGVYPVEVRRTKSGRIAEVRVVFIDVEEDR